jgi:hypothetical protein
MPKAWNDGGAAPFELSRWCANGVVQTGTPSANTVALTISPKGTRTMTSKTLRNIMIAGAAVSAIGVTACQPAQNNTDATNAAAAASGANAAASDANAAANSAANSANNAAAMAPPTNTTTNTTTTNTTTTNTTN